MREKPNPYPGVLPDAPEYSDQDHQKAWEIDLKVSSYLIDSGVIAERTDTGKSDGIFIRRMTEDNTKNIVRLSSLLDRGVYRTQVLLHEAVHYLDDRIGTRNSGEDDEAIASRVATGVLWQYGIDTRSYGAWHLTLKAPSTAFSVYEYEEVTELAVKILDIIEQGESAPEG